MVCSSCRTLPGQSAATSAASACGLSATGPSSSSASPASRPRQSSAISSRRSRSGATVRTTGKLSRTRTALLSAPSLPPWWYRRPGCPGAAHQVRDDGHTVRGRDLRDVAEEHRAIVLQGGEQAAQPPVRVQVRQRAVDFHHPTDPATEPSAGAPRDVSRTLAHRSAGWATGPEQRAGQPRPDVGQCAVRGPPLGGGTEVLAGRLDHLQHEHGGELPSGLRHGEHLDRRRHP